MADLKTPYAIDSSSGFVIKACNASKAGQYSCIECERSLSLRDGGVNQKHFAHPPTEHAGCQGESLIHKAAKVVLASQIQRELEDSGMIHFKRKCPGLEDRDCQRRSLVPGVREITSWTGVELEAAYKNFRLDVAIVNGDNVVYGFEVFHRHKVPPQKASGLDIRWMELVAEDILSFQPRIPYGYEQSNRRCPDCEELQRCLMDRKPEDQLREKTQEEYSRDSRKLKQTWETIINDAKRLDRESSEAFRRLPITDLNEAKTQAANRGNSARNRYN